MGLTSYLGGKFIVRQPAGRKGGQLLSANQGIHPVDGRDAGDNEIARIGATSWIDGEPVHVEPRLRDGHRDAIDGLTKPVENPAQHL